MTNKARIVAETTQEKRAAFKRAVKKNGTTIGFVIRKFIDTYTATAAKKGPSA